MRYFSMFSGIGGFELGIQRATKWECVGFSEIDKYAIATYQSHFPNHKNYGDATKINPNELPDFDLLCGGFPCQAFSIAGKRMGFEDTRGTLFFDIARIIKVKRPQYVFLENVKGLLSHDKGRTFTTILATLDELGYNAEWQVLNSKNFGVPQNRERVFIIGHLRGSSGQQVFPIRTSNRTAEKICNTIKAGYYKMGYDNPVIKINTGHQGNSVYGTEGIATTLNSNGGGQGGKTGLYVMPVLTPNRPEKRQNGRRFKNNGEEMFTLTGQDQHGVMIKVHSLQARSPNRPSLTKSCPCGSGKLYPKCCGVPAGSGLLTKKDGTTFCLDSSAGMGIEYKQKIRRLTPIECERLQGFPDGWTLGSDTQRYKQCGNAVTVNVIEQIVKAINNVS